MTKKDLRPDLASAYQQAITVTSAVSPDQLGSSTPCTQMDVSDLLDHLVFAARRAARLGHGQVPAVEQTPPHLDLGDVPQALREAAADAESGWSDDASLDRVVRMPWGEEYPGSALVGIYLVELTTHSWDLAVATDNQDLLEDALGVAALATAQETIRSDYRNDEGNPFGPEVPAPDDATDWDRLGAFMGRATR